MKIKDIVAEDFLNYKRPSMFIITAMCDWKCCIEAGLDISVCQNAPLISSPVREIPNETIYKQFHINQITKAVVIGGLEPFLQIDEVVDLISYFRANDEDCPFVIYTGYNENEVQEHLGKLTKLNNIIVKFGRFIPNQKHRFDDVLGIELVSENQYAKQIS